MTKEQELFEKVATLHEGTHDKVDIMLVSDPMDEVNEARFRVYHNDGYCFEVERQQHCESDEVDEYNDIHNLQPDGATYHFDDMGFDGFKKCDVDIANSLNIL